MTEDLVNRPAGPTESVYGVRANFRHRGAATSGPSTRIRLVYEVGQTRSGPQWRMASTDHIDAEVVTARPRRRWFAWNPSVIYHQGPDQSDGAGRDRHLGTSAVRQRSIPL